MGKSMDSPIKEKRLKKKKESKKMEKRKKTGKGKEILLYCRFLRIACSML